MRQVVLGGVLFAGLSWGVGVTSQTVKEPAPKSSPCTVSTDEAGLYATILRTGRRFPQVVVTRTGLVHFDLSDLDVLNLQAAASGRGIPLDVRTNFKEQNGAQCDLFAVAEIENVQYVSQEDAEKPRSRREFEKKYGKDADVVVFSRVGFNPDKTLALVHVSGGAGGALYLYEKKNKGWTLRWHAETWAS